MKGWYGHRQQHSMASKGIRTISNIKGINFYKCGNCNSQMNFKKTNDEDYWSCPNCGKTYSDFTDVRYIGKGRSMHGYIDRSWDEHIFKDIDREEISVIIFTEPDWEAIYEQINEDYPTREHMPDRESDWIKLTEKIQDDEEERFNKEGEVHVIWSGAVDFMGTEKEFADRYPELNRHLGLGLEADGILDAVITALIPKLIGSMGSKKEEEK